MNIPISKPDFAEEDFDNILKPLETGWVVQGKYVDEFERKWCDFTGAEYSVAVSSCTTALHLSLASLGIKPGDEVIVPSFTWVATANAVEYLSAKPVFCDIDLKTFNIDLNNIEKNISNKTKAIIPVHLFGLPVEMDCILDVAGKNNLLVIEDAACGFASKYKGKHVGNFGIAGCFSFHPRKAITTGEGGMITTNNVELFEKLQSLRNHGALKINLENDIRKKPYLLPEFPYLGYNYRMTDIQASIGSSQMNRANEIYEKRNKIAHRYIDELKNTEWLIKPFTNKNFTNGFQSFVCLLDGKKDTLDDIEKLNELRNAFMKYLFEKGISTRPGTHAVHNLLYYKNKYDIKPESNINSYIADKCSVALPIYPALTILEQDYIIDCIKKYKYNK